MNENFSRRDLFRKIVPIEQKKQDEKENKSPEPKEPGRFSQSLSRRDFLRTLRDIAVLLAVKSHEKEVSTMETKNAQSKDAILQEKVSQPKQDQSQSDKKTDDSSTGESTKGPMGTDAEDLVGSKFETAVEGTFLTIGELVASEVFHKLGYKNVPGVSEQVELWRQQDFLDKVFFTVRGVVVGPELEERVLRGIPSSIVGKGIGSREKRWDVGIPTSLLFALGHNLNIDFKELKVDFIPLKEFIPLTHFVSGVFYWYLMRERNLDHAVLAHRIHNAEAAAVFEILSRIMPKWKKEMT